MIIWVDNDFGKLVILADFYVFYDVDSEKEIRTYPMSFNFL